ncbi:MAG TPA: protein kinase, partial [Opitutaceae bacterium]|nr:protein kinase [Opitutaceae bacterium]
MDDLDLGSTIRGFAAGQKVFSRFALKRLLGRGGMGVVWLAHDEELERDVALKFLPELVAMDPEALRDLKRETRRSLELTHPHIIRIYDFVQDGRTAAISMEHVAGETLAKRKLKERDHCFQPRELLPWVEQLVAALEHAHRKAQVVHRDLKPANLMVDAHGDLKIADFGIAASVSDSVSRVSARVGSSGTPVYMSPQQMMGEKPAVTDDIYAVGATLYDLLTGKPPFHAGNVIAQVQSRVAPSLADRRLEFGLAAAEAIPPAWEETIAACLAKDPRQRPQSASELLARLSGGKASGPRATATATAAPQVAPPAPAAPEPPRLAIPDQDAPPAISPVRRWLGAPVVASVPATLVALAALIGSEEGGAEPVFFAIGLVLSAVGLMLLQYPLFVVLLAIRLRARAPWNVRSPAGISTLGALIGGFIGGIMFLDSGHPAGHAVAGVACGAAVGALQGWLFHRLAIGVWPADAARQAGQQRFILLAGAAALLAAMAFPGAYLPAWKQRMAAEAEAERRNAEMLQGLAAEAERLRGETTREQERLRREADEERERLRLEAEERRHVEQRRREAGPVIADAYRMVFDRRPTATELEVHTEQLVEDSQRDGAWLRQQLRESAEGRNGGRLLVPEEYSSISAAVAAAVPGNAVHVARGTYQESITLNKNVSLIGAGRDGVVVEADAAECALLALDVKGVVVTGFTFRHRNTNEDTNRASVVGLNGSSLTFMQNTVADSNGNGMHLKGSGQNTISGN